VTDHPLVHPSSESARERSDVIIAFEDVWFDYRPGEPVLEGANLEIRADDFLGVVGPNGSGKTTLLRLILGLERPRRGRVKVFGRKPSAARHHVGYVPQHAELDPTVPATALDVVLFGRLRHSAWGPVFGPRHHAAAHAALRRVRAEQLADRPIGSMSGGERQRVLIARAIACHTDVLLLDEPTTGVDFHAEQDLMELLTELNDELPIVMVSHDVSLVSSQLKRVACVARTISIHPAYELTPERLADLYGGSVSLVDHGDHQSEGHDSDDRAPADDPSGGAR